MQLSVKVLFAAAVSAGTNSLQEKRRLTNAGGTGRRAAVDHPTYRELKWGIMWKGFRLIPWKWYIRSRSF